jgi:Transposase IS116/IS110/IS902 family
MPIGYAGLAPRLHQSGERSHTGALSKAGSRTLRWAAVEAAHAAWRPTNPWHQLYSDIAQRFGKEPRQVRRGTQHPDRPAGTSSTASNPSNRPAPRRAAPRSRPAPAAFWPPDGPAWNREAEAAPTNNLRDQSRKRNQPIAQRRQQQTRPRPATLTAGPPSKRKQHSHPVAGSTATISRGRCTAFASPRIGDRGAVGPIRAASRTIKGVSDGRAAA